MRIAALLCLLLAASCSTTPTPIRGTGEDALPPHGWLDYCARRTDPACVQRGER